MLLSNPAHNQLEVTSQWHVHLKQLASLRLTLYLFGLFVVAILLYLYGGREAEWLIVTPLLLFSLNLFAALATHNRFRQQLPLLSFHLALILVLLLVAVGRLSYLKGGVEISSGGEFTGVLTSESRGPWHQWGLDNIRFKLDGFSIDYQPSADAGSRRGNTQALAIITDENGMKRSVLFGDHRPLMISGYNFYTSHNKGFSAQFLWQPASKINGLASRGTIHFPSYPAQEFRQALDWKIPGTNLKVWSQLDFDEVILDPEKLSQFRAPGDHKIILKSGGQRYEMVPGDTIMLDGGKLRYEKLNTWMGLVITHDWTLPWLIAAVVMALLSLGWHYWHRYSARPWLEVEQQLNGEIR